MQRGPIAELRNVSISRGRSILVRNIDITIHEGEKVAIFGPNGAGKSSLIKALTGDLRCDTSVDGAYLRIMGEDLWNIFDVRRAFGIVTSDLQMEFCRDMDAVEAVLSGFFGSIGTNRSQELTQVMEDKAKRSLASVGSEHLAARKMHTLSTGEVRRVLMARALVNDPKALILDEPMNALDLTGKHLVREALIRLANSGKGMILVTHDPSDLIPEIERVILMQNGQIFKDGDIRVMSEENLSALFKVKVHLSSIDGRYFAWS